MSHYLATDFSNKIVLTQRNLSLFEQGAMSRFGIIVTMEIDSAQITSVHKARLTRRCMRVCHSGHRKVSVVRIKQGNFRGNM